MKTHFYIVLKQKVKTDMFVRDISSQENSSTLIINSEIKAGDIATKKLAEISASFSFNHIWNIRNFCRLHIRLHVLEGFHTQDIWDV